MRTITLATLIAASPEICFDLALDLDEHAKSAAQTGERVVATTATGILALNDAVTFEARHFGLRWRMTARISAYERPFRFFDEQVTGPFRWFRHEHRFEPVENATRMTDVFEFAAPFGWIAEPVLARHLQSFLKTRAAYLKQRAETEAGNPKSLSGEGR